MKGKKKKTNLLKKKTYITLCTNLNRKSSNSNEKFDEY